MFIDGRTVPAGTLLQADIAIIGGGAAGITLARALTGRGIQIAVIESGGFEFDEATQALYAGSLGAQNYGAPDVVRLRYFGGSTNHWGGWLRPLDAIDFEARAWVPDSGWPISRATIDPYYPAAQAIVEGGDFLYEDAPAVHAALGATPAFGAAHGVETRFFQYSPPTRFGERYRAELEASADVRIYLNTNVTEIVATSDLRSVRRLSLACLDGRRFDLAARIVVLAAGGIENARLLLNSDSVAEGGLGNGRDLVGRYFADHPIVQGVAALMLRDKTALPKHYTQDVATPRARVRATFSPTEDAMRANGWVASLTTIEPPNAAFSPEDGFPDWASSWVGGNKSLADALAAIWFGQSGRLPVLAPLSCGIEPRPDRDSRVTLSEERDALGLRRAKVDWRLGDRDIKDYFATLLGLANDIGASGAGQMFIHPDIAELYPERTSWASHHLGTTRMHDDPAQGVINSDCRVHGLANLYVAGSSVHTTPGAANPTLTIVALTLRLAEHLKALFP